MFCCFLLPVQSRRRRFRRRRVSAVTVCAWLVPSGFLCRLLICVRPTCTHSSSLIKRRVYSTLHSTGEKENTQARFTRSSFRQLLFFCSHPWTMKEFFRTLFIDYVYSHRKFTSNLHFCKRWFSLLKHSTANTRHTKLTPWKHHLTLTLPSYST